MMFVFKVAIRDKPLSPLKWEIYIHLGPSLGEGNGTPLQFSCLEAEKRWIPSPADSLIIFSAEWIQLNKFGIIGQRPRWKPWVFFPGTFIKENSAP